MDIYSAEAVTGDNLNGIYQLLARLAPKVCVDVGAAAGDTARLILNAKPDRLYAIEPFPGNWRFLDQVVSNHPHIMSGRGSVVVHKAAAGASAGKRSLICTSQVGGQEKGWEDKVGYSSVSRFPRKNETGNLEVECIVIDDEIPEAISFLKIDVQGAEREVLDGCSRHFESGRVDLCYVEYAGEPDLLTYFKRFGFKVFYTPTMVVSREGGVIEKVPTAKILNSKPLSTGAVGEYFWDSATPKSASEMPAYFKSLRQHCQYAQTDLICVAPHFLAKFEEASKAAR